MLRDRRPFSLAWCLRVFLRGQWALGGRERVSGKHKRLEPGIRGDAGPTPYSALPAPSLLHSHRA